MRDDNTEPRDNQQMQDDNQQSGESVMGGQDSGDARQPRGIGSNRDPLNRESNQEPAEGSRDDKNVPPRTRGDEGPLD